MGVAFTVLYHPLVLKNDLPKIGSAHRARLKKVIEEKLLADPALFGIPLRQSLKGHRKLRVGDYRIVFSIEKQTVFVLAILHRSIVYQMASNRQERN